MMEQSKVGVGGCWTRFGLGFGLEGLGLRILAESLMLRCRDHFSGVGDLIVELKVEGLGLRLPGFPKSPSPNPKSTKLGNLGV